MIDFSSTYEVTYFAIGDTKAGNKMGKLQLKNQDNETVLNCLLWEETLNRLDHKIFRTGNLVRVISGSYNEKYNNCILSALELIKEAKLGLNKEEQNKIFEQIVSYVEEIKDLKLKSFVLNQLEENETAFKITPAAKLMHHNYIGGLLQHTFECLEFAKAIYPLFSAKENKDFIIAGCILHDMGKIFEYKVDLETGLVEYNEDFKKTWVSHSLYGYSICMNAGYPLIARAIAAHHSRSDWGAVIDLNEKELEPLLYLIHHIDDLSAKFGKISIASLG